VRVDRRVVRELGTLVQDGDRVEVDGKPVVLEAQRRYVVINKPAGVVTTMRDPQGRRTIAELVPPGARVVPVGRLDYDTSGVLLLTNDGALAHRLLHPRFGVEKTYRAVVTGQLSASDVRRMLEGVDLGDVRASGAKLRVVATRRDRSVVDVTLHEGRNRQVRRMFEALGHPVVALTRLRFGPISLGALAPGRTRSLTARESAALGAFRAEVP
jgi:23S rRNA pseudouridine2605 synthase